MIKRRKFIKSMTALGVVSATAPLSSYGQNREAGQAHADKGMAMARKFTVYRFQTRKMRACNACKQHHRYKVFLDHDAADQNRAHQGCHCRIVTQQVSALYLRDIRHYAWNGVIDLREVYGL